MSKARWLGSVVFGLGCVVAHSGLAADRGARSAELTAAVEPKVIEWRRDFHRYPELSNHEFETSKKLAGELERLGFEVRTGIAHTGVLGILRGARPGPVVAVRADMDALPVREQVDLPFASKETSTYNNQETGVMHACGHDTHMAMILGVAEVFAGLQPEMTGTLMVIFQPAEEGTLGDDKAGAELMLEEGLFEILRPDVIFGFHAWSALNAGQIGYRAGPAMASSDRFRIVVQGRQTHGSRPWGGTDPIVVAAQIVLGLQTIASRQVDVTKAPSVISVGRIHGGIRNNIIPDQVELIGTVRTFDEGMRQDIAERINTTAVSISGAAGTAADVDYKFGYPVTVNDAAVTARSVPVLEQVAGSSNVFEMQLITGAEDFSYFQRQVPGFYFFLGVTPPGQDASAAPSNHSPLFFVDESMLSLGVRAMTALVLAELGRGG